MNPFIHKGAHWAMKRKQLPQLCQGPFDYDVVTWKGQHPSPAFADITVWYTKRIEQPNLGSLLKRPYSRK
jgi:hypothetical protein